MAQKRRQLGEILKRWGLVDDRQISEAMKVAEASRKRVGEALVQLGYVSQNDVAKALASQFDMEFVDMDQPNVINKDYLGLIPPDLIKKYTVLPLGQEGDYKIKVLVHDPMDLALIDDLHFRLGKKVELALGAKEKIKEYIDRMLSETRASIDEAVAELSIDRGESLDIEFAAEQSEPSDEEMADAQQAPIIRLVNEIIKEAVVTRASDIHVEPFENRVRLRYRIDGVCHERDIIPKRTQGSVIARLKIMAGMKVEEKRVPQDGRIKMKVGGDPIDFRVSACPAYHGESVVLRILRPDAANLGLEKLGMQDDTREQFDKIITRPNGIFLVTGPTGSGKTTTLYSALQVLNRPDKKIITAEDPIEYNFKGINQCQVNEQIGLSFAKILRAMLRQAPNIILVGEIRDKEVGEVAVQAALTGHLVFSTLHTNDAPSAITRLIDMGLKPFLVASSIQAVLAQRLVRILCDHCKQPDTEPDSRMLGLVGLTKADLAERTIYKAEGCNRCANTGYRGRQGIYELMMMNSEIRELAFNRAPVNKVRSAAKASGMRNLLGDGRLKILEGKTTLEEVARIAQVEGLLEMEDDEGLAA
ncbi:MAG: type II/IV secretion system protein [Planctomycetes bacterium]|jgi:type IV pilus assembly protein PilB|nr:type II/IV secretion system protein [Planctomycetota bacterium]